jgi:NhaC family Na+:H+ antiporter
MQVSGALDVLLARLLASVRSTFALVAATMTAGVSVIGLTSHASVTMLVVGGLVRDAYRERALPPVLLSRSLEDSVTITEVLMPWTVSAVFMAGTLGVPTLAYAPWAVFCWMGPMMSLVLAAVGAGRRRALPIREADRRRR